MEFTRCYHCMGVTETYPCPHCGYDPAKEPPQPHALKPSTILNGKYVVGAILGQGGFGITYIGWDLALESKVAIKEYYPAGQVVRSPENSLTLQWYTTPQAEAARSAGRDMFLKEARKMSRVGAIPQVVRVRDLFQQNETAYIVMDFVEGETLMSRLKRNGPLSWEEAQRIFFPAIRAMEQVHQEGLIHRDLSPDNLMLLPNGDVRILDLGAAKDLNINSGASSMQVAKGGFSPLEQYTQRGGSGTWSDVYAMAATMYYSLTGVLPPASVDRVETDSLLWDLPALTALPQNVLKALQQAMGVFVKDRIQTMGAFLSALESGKAKKKTRKKGGAPRALLILLAVALVGFGAWKLLTPRPEEPEKTTSVPQPAPTSATAPAETEETIPEETFDLSPYEGVPLFFDYDTVYNLGCVYSCTLYDLENGQSKILVEFTAPEGCPIEVECFQGSDPPLYAWTSPKESTGKRQTIAFEFPTGLISGANEFCLRVGDVLYVSFNPLSQTMILSDGAPIGEVRQYTPVFENGFYQCHSLTTQELDNENVRFTIVFTAPTGMQASFVVANLTSEWDCVINCMANELTVFGRQTLIWDVPRDKLLEANAWQFELYDPFGDRGHDVFALYIVYAP